MRTVGIQASENAQGGTGAGPAQTEQYTNPARRRLLLQRFWRSAAGFWRTEEDRRSWTLSAIIMLTVLLSLAASIGMNYWNRAIFDALEQRDADTVLFWSIVYVPLLALSVFFVVVQVYARMTMQWRWRAWLNNHLLDRWLTNGRYYQLNLVGGDHANPEYRIADDIRVATEAPVDFSTGLATAFLSAATFIVVLWTIGGSITFTVAGTEVTIPGFLVIAAVLYTALASGSMMLIGRGFVAASEKKNQSEAKQRLAFARILLHRPTIVVLDEATSALDPESQDRMMELLTHELGATTIVSVAHRPELEAFHDRKITLERHEGGARLISDILHHEPARGSFLRRWLG